MAFNLTGYRPLLSEDGRLTVGSAADPTGWTLKDDIKQSAEAERPFVLRPTFIDPRMAAQESFFLGSACPPAGRGREYREKPRPSVDGMYLAPSSYLPPGVAEEMLFDVDPDFPPNPQAMGSFLIPAALKPSILSALERNFNRTASILFPDFDGLRTYGMADVD